ncbi:MAG TPA: tetrahydrofolate dehydrogenase/cyclohydrolase catalytic domain-containing protein [Chitinophagales bacterium]|nr:bifunctional 5,10-methylene-tetrahydrofolate dehydrogenase/5,10-methylene-tetrahydrofolate cyclohydrolase [Chitinophagales bacterium]HMX05863.1 tetrahydrofolate dehydrogenase/cyclohydrolase catalytic domain-containing protein [Chitinophagales bacterium]HMZ87778.1 tetrahydrofolate dehydrogenase/cyclohydrolase catalytic domain-containing protein [Chitinophagales bacterium]HNA56915.1 tetrahydrofolate dehydrogenase/cyclohydrolase catalytic domain-containing protein [Chitinophagales bacterium]HNE
MAQPIILDGKKLSTEIQDEIRKKIDIRRTAGLKIPHLAAVLVGNDGASTTYVNSKIRLCKSVGMQSTLIHLDASTSEEELLRVVHDLNTNPDIDGFIVQLPLPKHIQEMHIVEAIDPSKDVDGFHPVNLGRMQLGLPAFISATPAGIMTMLSRYHIDTAGKHCVVIGRSNNVGTPMSLLLSRNTNPGNCTVTLCHSRTKNLTEICRSADIIIAALGKPKFVTGDMVKEGAVVIDIGISRVDADNEKGYLILGDVDFPNVAPKCSAISPVPGGVGLMTVVSLIMNTMQAAESRDKL